MYVYTYCTCTRTVLYSVGVILNVYNCTCMYLRRYTATHTAVHVHVYGIAVLSIRCVSAAHTPDASQVYLLLNFDMYSRS